MGFTPLDYTVLVLYLAGTALLAARLGRGQRSLDDYFLGGGHMPWWAICLSIVATETSTLTFIGVPAIAYSGNLTFLQLSFGYLLGRILVSWLLIPGYFEKRIQTAYEVLNRRFGRGVRQLAAGVFQVTRLLADGVRLFATALVLGVVTGLGDFWTIVLIAAVTVAYTWYGGMKAVVYNDVVQLAIYVGGALLAAWILLDRIPGGWQAATAAAAPLNKLQWIDLRFDPTVPYTLWAGLLGGAFLTFATHGTDQMMVQRYLACGDRSRSQLALVASGVVIIVQFLLFLTIGILLFAYYRQFPPTEPFTQTDRIFPTFIVEQMPSGLAGLVIAAIFAAAMSSLSSSLNSLASSSINDFYRPWLAQARSERHYLAASRMGTLLWGALLVGVALLAGSWGNVLEAGLAITGFTMGSVLGVFLLARTRAGSRAAVGGMAAGLAMLLLVSQATPLAWPWYVPVGALTTLGVGRLLAAAGIDHSREST